MIVRQTLETQMNMTSKVVRTDVKCQAYLNGNQLNLTDTSNVKVNLNAELYDIGNNFDIGNYRFVAPVTGYYLVVGEVTYTNVIIGGAQSYYAKVYVGGSVKFQNVSHPVVAQTFSISTSGVTAVTAGQYIELYAQVYCGASTVDIYGAANMTCLSIHLLSMD
jgi:hypothetical protein